MAEKKLVDKLNKYSKHVKVNDVFYDGEKKSGHYNERYTEFGGISLINLKKAIKKSAQNLSTYAEFNGTISDLQSNGFLKDDFLDRCRGKELKRIYKVLSKMNLFMRSYAKKVQALSSPNAKSVKEKYLKAIECYKDVLKFGNEGLLDLEKLETFDTDAFAKDIEKTYKDFLGNEQSSNLNRTSMRDLEVVRALEYTGIYLKREIVDGKSVWAVDMDKTRSSTNGISYLDDNNIEQHFRLSFEGSDSQIQSFLNEYLNKDEKDRNGAVITPEGIFKLYVEESTSSLKTFMGHVFGFGRDNKEIEKAIEETRKRYSVENPEWQAFSKSSERIAVADASKLALVDLFRGRLSSRQDIVPEEVQDVIQNNDLVNDKWVNKFLEIGDRFNDLSDSQISDAYSPANDIVQKYITAKEDIQARLEDKNLTNEERLGFQNSLETIEKSIATIDLVRKFELQFVEKSLAQEGQNLQGEDLRNKYVEIINNLSECDFLNVQQNPQGFYEIHVNDKVKELPDNVKSLCEEIVEEVNASSVKSSEEPEKESTEKELTDDKLLQLILEHATVDSNNHAIGDSLESYEILKRTEFLTSEGKDNEILDLFKKYRELKDKNPDAIGTLEEFIRDFGDQLGFDKNVDNALYTGETLSVVEALSRSNDPEYRKSDDYQNALKKRNTIVNNANMYYALVDRIAKNLKSKRPDVTAENLTPEEIKGEYDKVLQERAKGTFNPTPEEIAQAKAKYEDKFSKLSLANAFDEVLKDPDFKNSRLNQDLMGQMKKVFGEDFDKDKKESKEENNLDEEIKKIKFSDKYPKKDETALLKKFKPYCAKSTGKIIDNLLKMIQGIEITIKNPPIKTEGFNRKPPEPPKVPDDKEVESTDDRPVPEDDNEDESNKNDNEDENHTDKDEPEKEEGEDVPTEEKPEDDLEKDKETLEDDKEDNKTSKDNDEKQVKNNIGISDRQFATYRMLAVGLQAILKTPPFEQNRKLLNGEEKSKIDSLSKVLNYIVSEPKDKEEADFKNFLAWEIDYKSRTVDGKYNADTRINNSEFFKSEFPKYAPDLVDDINNVIFNLKNIEELGAIIGITTDREKENPEIGNKLTDKMVESIINCKDETSVWLYIQQNPELYETGLWYVPAEMSSKLEIELRKIQEEERKREEEELKQQRTKEEQEVVEVNIIKEQKEQEEVQERMIKEQEELEAKLIEEQKENQDYGMDR